MSIQVLHGHLITKRRPLIVRFNGTGVPDLPYMRLGQQASNSHGGWYLLFSNTLDDREFASRGYHVLSPAFDLSKKAPAERLEVASLVAMFRKQQLEAFQATGVNPLDREHELMATLPRLTISGGYDLDVTNEETAARYAGLIKAEELRRGVVLRESYSGGAVSPKRHLEWGHAEKGHTHLLLAAHGHATDVLKACGFVEVAAHQWRLPDADAGHGCVEIKNLQRDPHTRDSVFRALGGHHKQWSRDNPRCKELVPGSPQHGSTFTVAMVEEGLRLYGTFEKDPKRKRRTRVLPPIPTAKQGKLGHAETVVETWWREGIGHDLRLALAGTLLSTGFVTHANTSAVVLATTTAETVHDARVATDSTLMRMKQKVPIFGANKLRALVGSYEVFKLAQALALDVRKALLYTWGGITPKKRNAGLDQVKAKDSVVREEAVKMLEAVKRLEVLATDHKIDAMRGTIHRIRRRLQSSAYCGQRRADGRCPGCKKLRCQKHLYCNDPSCNACTIRRITDVIETMLLPPSTAVAVIGGFTSKKAASKAYGKVPKRGDKRPLAVYAITPEGTWELMLMCDQADRAGVGAIEAIADTYGGDLHQCQQPHQVRNWITRAMLLKHVTARTVLERGDEASTALLVEAYRKHVASSGETSIQWPSKAAMAELRQRKMREAAEARGELTDEECPCPDEYVKLNPAHYEIVNTDTGEILLKDLLSPPTLAQLIAHELGEKIKLHRRRRFMFGGSRR